jgi:hypothetical protein
MQPNLGKKCFQEWITVGKVLFPANSFQLMPVCLHWNFVNYIFFCVERGETPINYLQKGSEHGNSNFKLRDPSPFHKLKTLSRFFFRKIFFCMNFSVNLSGKLFDFFGWRGHHSFDSAHFVQKPNYYVTQFWSVENLKRQLSITFKII